MDHFIILYCKIELLENVFIFGYTRYNFVSKRSQIYLKISSYLISPISDVFGKPRSYGTHNKWHCFILLLFIYSNIKFDFNYKIRWLYCICKLFVSIIYLNIPLTKPLKSMGTLRVILNMMLMMDSASSFDSSTFYY